MLFVEEVCRALSDHGVRYALAGGHAVALHGAVRGTVDVDVVIDWKLQSLTRAAQAVESLGLVSRLPVTAGDVFRFRDEYIANRNLIAWNFHHPTDPSRQVDILIDYDLSGRRRQAVRTASGTLYILARDDLAAMKKASGRAQDRADVEALEKLGAAGDPPPPVG